MNFAVLMRMDLVARGRRPIRHGSSSQAAPQDGPKAATLTHLNLLMMSLAYLADIQAATFEHCIFHAAPMSHGTGLLAIPHVAKASANVLLESRSMNHDEIFDLLHSYRHVTMYHTPTMLKRMVNHPGLGNGAAAQP